MKNHMYENYHSNDSLKSESFFIMRMRIICTFKMGTSFNPLSPHDALKHHFQSLKTNLISLQLEFL